MMVKTIFRDKIQLKVENSFSTPSRPILATASFDVGVYHERDCVGDICASQTKRTSPYKPVKVAQASHPGAGRITAGQPPVRATFYNPVFMCLHQN